MTNNRSSGQGSSEGRRTPSSNSQSRSQGSTSRRTGTGQRSATSRPPRAPKLDITRSYITLFVTLFSSQEYQTKFGNSTFQQSKINEWLANTGNNTASPQVVQDIFKLSLDKHTKGVKRTAASRSPGPSSSETKTAETQNEDTPERKVLMVLKTPQISQIFRAALSIQTYGRKDKRVLEIFRVAIQTKKLSPKFIVGSRYIPRILGANKITGMVFNPPSVLDVLLFFHCCSVHNNSPDCKEVSSAGNRIGLVIQTLMSAWSRLFSLFKNQTVGRIRDAFTPYIIFKHDECQFEVLDSRSRGFSNAEMVDTLQGCKISRIATQVNVDAFNRDVHMDSALRYVVSLFFKHLNKLVSRPFLYSSSDTEAMRWGELQKFKLPSDMNVLPEVFEEVPTTICDTLGLEKKCEAVEPVEESVSQVLVDADSLEITGRKRKRQEEQAPDDEGSPTKTVPKSEPKEEPGLIDTLQNLHFRPFRNRDMSKATGDMYDVLNDLFKQYFNFYDIPIDQLVPELTQLGKDVEESIALFIADPPYNVRKDASKDNSDYDVFTEKDISDLCELAKFCLAPGKHGLIFCTYQQFELYRKHLNKYEITVPDRDTDATGNTTCKRKLFVVEPVPIVVVRKHGLGGQPVRGGSSHTNITELIVHFWKRGTDSRESVDFQSLPSFTTKFPAWANVITDVPQPTGSEIRWVQEEQERPDRNASGKVSKRMRRFRLRPEQKSIELLKHLISKFSDPGDLVMDPCGGTFSCLHACMAMDRHRKFIGSDADPDCLLAVEDDLIREFALQVLNPESDLVSSNEEYTKAAQTVKNHHILTKVNERYTAWSIPPGLVPMQSFPEHIVETICQYYNDYSLLSNYIRRDKTFTPAQKWTHKWLQRFNEMDPQALLSAECLALKVRIKPSNIQHPHVGLGVFAKKAFQKGEVIGYYYGALVYGDIGEDHRSRRKYGSGMMAVSTDDYLKWALRVALQFRDSQDKMHVGYICPGPFCAMRYINDSRYTEGDNEKDRFDRGLLQNPREVNVAYIENKRFNTSSMFESYKAVAVKATKDILPGQELFLNYGDSYSFPDLPKTKVSETDNSGPKNLTQGFQKNTSTETKEPETKQTGSEAEVTKEVPNQTFEDPFTY